MSVIRDGAAWDAVLRGFWGLIYKGKPLAVMGAHVIIFSGGRKKKTQNDQLLLQPNDKQIIH